MAVAVNLARGRRLDCGCGGTIAPRQISWGLVVWDALLSGLAVLVGVEWPVALSIDGYVGLAPGPRVGFSTGVAMLLIAMTVAVLQGLFATFVSLRPVLTTIDRRSAGATTGGGR